MARTSFLDVADFMLGLVFIVGLVRGGGCLGRREERVFATANRDAEAQSDCAILLSKHNLNTQPKNWRSRVFQVTMRKLAIEIELHY